MGLSYVTWSFIGLFFLFGFALLASDGAAWRETWAGLSVLALGAFGVSMAKDAVTSGQIRIQFSVIRRASQPQFFWIMTVLAAAAGVVALIGGIWILFFKS